MELPVNRELKLYGRAGESAEDFALRCRTVADERADAELAKLRDKYEAKATTLRNRLEAASDAAQVARDQQEARSRDDLLSSAGSILGGLLGGRRSRGGLLGQIGRAAGRAGQHVGRRGTRVEAAENKAARLQDRHRGPEAELAEELTEIDQRWLETAAKCRVDDRLARAHRRQGDPAGARLAPGAVTSPVGPGIATVDRRSR